MLVHCRYVNISTDALTNKCLCFLPTFLCSAGVGRTGTFITIDMVLQQVEQEGYINIMDIINQLRHKRMKMVQTLVRNHILKKPTYIKSLNLICQSISIF